MLLQPGVAQRLARPVLIQQIVLRSPVATQQSQQAPVTRRYRSMKTMMLQRRMYLSLARHPYAKPMT
jgi:hypothetical protein